LQLPVSPQGGAAVHWLVGTGGVPLRTGLQMPSAPPVSAALHASQVPLHK
jgi:hypothetical protein